MFHLLTYARKSLGWVALLVIGLGLAACDGVPTGAGGNGGPTINTRSAVPVALLVPGGSGQASDDLLAQSLENAARLAIADLGDVEIDLRVYNTAGQAAQAATVAEQAVADGAKIILGPIFAEESNAAGVAVAGQNINVLSFSNNTDIAGGNVFVLGNTFQNTAERLVGYAARQGKARIAIVQDRTTAGDVGRRAIEAAAAAAGVTIAATGSYEFSQEGVVAAIPTIAASLRASGADAVVLTADSAGALPLLTQLLSENQVNPATTTFIGLTRWDIPAATLDLPGVQGGWFALPDPALAQQFSARYAAAYGEQPHPISGLAYDGIAAIGALVKAGRSNALAVSGLTQGSGFVGVNGVFRLRADGTNQRGLAIAQILNHQVVIIDPAPRAFGGTGF